VFSYIARLIHRFREENFAQLAASLSFTTLLSIVPFVAVILTVASLFPLFGQLVGQLDNFLVANLLPGKAGGVVAKYTYQFSQKASRLTFAGIAVLAVTSVFLMFSIEKAFNHLWRVGKPRPFVQRFALYAAVMVVGPLVAGAILGTMSYAVSLSLGFFNEPVWLRQGIFKVLALIMLGGFFTFLYYAVPNARVRPGHALFGGVLAALGVAVMQRLFEIYLAKFPTYTLIYGAFATLPIFLVWLYLCWTVVLVGALVVANFSPGGHKAHATRAARKR
jgi:membrane protein